jgi:hypothetical protein
MKTKVQYEWTDYLNAQLLHIRPSGFRRIGLYLILAALACTVVSSIYLAFTRDFSFDYFWPVLLIILLWPLYRFVLLPNRIKKLYSQQKTLQVPVEVEIKEDTLNTTSEFGQNTHPWKDFVKWKEDKELFLLYQSDVAFNMLPKRMFSDPTQIDAVRSYLQKNVPKEKQRFPFGCIVYFLLFIFIGIIMYISFRNSVSP